MYFIQIKLLSLLFYTIPLTFFIYKNPSKLLFFYNLILILSWLPNSSILFSLLKGRGMWHYTTSLKGGWASPSTEQQKPETELNKVALPTCHTLPTMLIKNCVPTANFQSH
jgi:hypothetical protein